ncbi:restriction endonuclease subunit S [Segatella copri]|uniref:restriction endonuclease subunit S n=1 Tax=Segatella copri TaxID=165179 RepID=UPI0011823C34|nr:restriction endonuclease subunit S [Segatella copri]
MNGKQLKNSILQWAIQGKLVPQDPNDEPASVLLEKIRQEKERLIKEKKIKRDKNASIIYRGEDNSYYEKMLATGEVKCIDEEVPFEIPQGWEWCRLNDLYNFIDYRGATPHKLSKGIPLITAKNVKQGYLDYTVKDFISSEEYSNRLSRGVSHKGDILFTTEAPLGNVAIADLDVYSAGQRLITLQAYIQCFTNNDMFMFFMLSPLFQELVMSYKTGTTVAGIKASKLKEVLIPTPPISEQSRIVKKLQTLLPFIEKYSRSQTLLNIFNTEIKDKLRKSFLQEAIRGKLVPQIAEDGTAQELLEQIKAEKQELVKEGKLKRSALNDSVIFRGGDNRYYEKIGKKCVDITEEIPFEIPASWAWCHLNDIAESDLGKTMNKGQNSGELVPYLCSINVYWNKIDLSKIKQAQFTEIELAKYLLQKNDLLICEGGDIGRAAIWDINETIYYQNALHRVRFYGKIFPKFFLYILSLYKALGLLDKKSKGMTIKHFTKSALNSIVIPLPPLLEQKRIIEKIEQLMQLLK